MTAEYKVHGNVAVITLANPPVNGLGLSTRQGIVDGLEKANADSAVKSIVITGAGGAFSGGADIKEFGTDKAMQEPTLNSVIAAIENSDKPVVAAIHSVAMGGGLELALGCHYRVAAPGCSVALPEVKLGILPGAGGTQRLPRVLGVEPALNMIVSGEAIKSEMLAMLPGQKLFDKLVASPEVLAAAAIEGLRGMDGPRVLDLCAGSGCIGLAVAKHVPSSHVVLGELDEGALRVCRQNIRRTGLSGQVVSMQLNALEKAPPRLGEFDCIVSNPPYIAADDPHLQQGDLRFEPAGALTDFADGLSCIRQLIAGAPAHLRPGGWLLMEHGWQQAPAVRELLSAAGFIDVASWQDLAGHERVTGGRWR